MHSNRSAPRRSPPSRGWRGAFSQLTYLCPGGVCCARIEVTPQLVRLGEQSSGSSSSQRGRRGMEQSQKVEGGPAWRVWLTFLTSPVPPVFASTRQPDGATLQDGSVPRGKVCCRCGFQVADPPDYCDHDKIAARGKSGLPCFDGCDRSDSFGVT
jgi:hypothetical protein